MKKWNELSKEEQQKLYEHTLNDINGCCDCWEFDFEEADGICPTCGSVTSGRRAVCGCNWSPVACEVCGAAPCDLSC